MGFYQDFSKGRRHIPGWRKTTYTGKGLFTGYHEVRGLKPRQLRVEWAHTQVIMRTQVLYLDNLEESGLTPRQPGGGLGNMTVYDV